MSIITPKPPEHGLDILRMALGSTDQESKDSVPVSEFDIALSKSPGLEARDVGVAAPHPVYFVGLIDVVRGNILSAAELTGWRYILVSGNTPLISAVLNADEGGDAVDFSHSSSGSFVASTVECVRLAEGLEKVRTNDYELRLLKIPALYVAALWLHGDDDIILPLAPAPVQLTAHHPYTEEEFTGALYDEAERILADGQDFTGRSDEESSKPTEMERPSEDAT